MGPVPKNQNNFELLIVWRSNLRTARQPFSFFFLSFCSPPTNEQPFIALHLQTKNKKGAFFADSEY